MGIDITPSAFVPLPTVPRPQLLGRGVLSVGPDPPAGPMVGDLWWRTQPDATLLLYYDDGSSAQWVTADSAAGLVSGTTPRWIQFPNTPLTVGQRFTATNGISYTWDGVAWVADKVTGLAIGSPAGGMLDGTYPNPIIRVRTQILRSFSGLNTWNPGSTTWQELATFGPFISRGGPIMLTYNLSARLHFTAFPAGTTAWAQFGWGLNMTQPPDIWLDQIVTTMVGGAGGTVVEVPIPPSITFDQQAAGGFTYHLLVLTSDPAVSVISNGGRAWVYELA